MATPLHESRFSGRLVSSDSFRCTDCGARIGPGDQYIARLVPGQENEPIPITYAICVPCARDGGWEGDG